MKHLFVVICSSPLSFQFHTGSGGAQQKKITLPEECQTGYKKTNKVQKRHIIITVRTTSYLSLGPLDLGNTIIIALDTLITINTH